MICIKLTIGGRANRTAFAAVALLAALSAAAACGDGGAAPPASPTSEPSPAATLAARPTPRVTPSLPPGDAPPSIDLAATDALLTVYGAGRGDFLSDIPALTTGDFNEDGFADILVGARFGDGPADDREDAGQAYVIFGAAQPRTSVDIAGGEQDLTIYGETEGGDLGFSAAAGDVNDDGVDDILVGAPFAGGRSGSGGTVYVVFGGRDLGGTVDVAGAQQDVTINGPGGNSLFGDSLAVGDVNGDGINDIIIGSTFAADRERGIGNVGAVYVIFGSAGLAD